MRTFHVIHRIFHECVENYRKHRRTKGRKKNDAIAAALKFVRKRNGQLTCNFLKEFLINIEVGVHVLHVVVFFERFH